MEILLVAQHVHALVVDVEEGLQVFEFVGGAHLFHRVEGEIDSVASGDLEHQIGLEAAFDMHMQFGFRQGANEIVRWSHCLFFSLPIFRDMFQDMSTCLGFQARQIALPKPNSYHLSKALAALGAYEKDPDPR